MNKTEILRYVESTFERKEHKPFRVGDTIRAHVKIIEGDAARVQAFEGTVISVKGEGAGRNFTIRKISFGVGVERTFPLTSPALEKIEVIRSGHSRRAKLYYLRNRVGRAAKLEDKETGVLGDMKKAGDAASSATPAANAELAVAEKK